MWKLEFEGALEEGKQRTWIVNTSKIADILSEGLLAPISQAFHHHPEHTQVLWTFLLDAALCGELVPVNILIDFQVSGDEAQEELNDVIEKDLVERLQIFEDLQYTHPSFPHSVSVCRFRERITRLAILEHFPLRERRARAELLAPALRRTLSVSTRDIARLFISLADYLGEDERDNYLRELEWWTGNEESDDLREGLIEAISEGRLKPEVLWGALKATEGRWPAYRRLALLDAYGAGPRDEKGNPLGVPLERLGDFQFLRATILEALGQYSEAVIHAELSLNIHKAHSGKNSLPAMNVSILLGIVSLQAGELEHARTILQDLLPLARQILGPEHSTTIATKFNLASVFWAQGELAHARELLEEVLEIRIRLLGCEHPDTLRTKSDLASLLDDHGELPRARELLTWCRQSSGEYGHSRALAIQLQDHPGPLPISSNARSLGAPCRGLPGTP